MGPKNYNASRTVREPYRLYDTSITYPRSYLVAWTFHRLGLTCETPSLRSINSVFISGVFVAALLYRLTIKSPKHEKSKCRQTIIQSTHIAFNIALFPPLFFFSALFYTDIASTASVLLSLVLFVHRDALDALTNKVLKFILLASTSLMPIGGPLLIAQGSVSTTAILGLIIFAFYGCSSQRITYVNLVLAISNISALWFRQTNVFWTTLFPMGLAFAEYINTEHKSNIDASVASVVQNAYRNGDWYNPILVKPSICIESQRFDQYL